MGKFAGTLIELDQQRNQELRAAAIATQERDPDRYARAAQIAAPRNLSPDVVDDNLADFEHDDHLQRLDALAKDAPETAAFLTDPKRMALAKDDLPNLTSLHAAMRAVNGDHSRSWSEFGGDLALRFKQGARDGVLGLLESPVNAVNLINRGFNAAANTLAGAFGQTTSSQVGMYQQPKLLRTLRAETEALQAGEYDRGASFKLAGQDSSRPDTFAGAIEYAARNPSSLTTDLSSSFGAMSSAVVPGSSAATIALQASGQAGMAAAEVRKTMLDRGYSEQQAQAAAAEAFGAASLVGLIAPNVFKGGAAFERLIAGDAQQLAGSTTRRALTDLFGESVSEAGEEAGVQLSQNVSTGDPLGKGVGAAAAGGLTMGVGVGSVAAVAEVTRARDTRMERGTVETVTNAITSLNDAGRLAEITRLAGESKLAGRSPETVAELAPDETVYLPAEAARTLFQSDDLNALVTDLTGDPQALAAAGTHGDLAIPMSKWASVVARMGNAEEIAKHARTQVDGLSRVELESLDLDAELAALDGQPAATESTADAVQQDVLAQLLATGTYKPADAELQAGLVGKVFGTIAARTGQDAKALYDRYQLRIAGPKQGLVQRATGAVKSLLQAAFHGTPHTVDKFSLQKIGTGEGQQAYGWGLYFASQKEVAEHYRTTLTGIAKMPGAKAAEAALAKAGGNRAEAIARLTRAGDTEAVGFLRRNVNRGSTYQVEVPEDDVLLDWDKPLSEQTAGVRAALRPVLARWYGADNVDYVLAGGEGAPQKGSDLYVAMGYSQQASEMLREAGIPGLRFLDGVSRAGGGTHNYVIWDEAAITDVRRLNQSVDQTETPAFKRWFGDSKVVDDQGKPLVVYHGTRADFTEFRPNDRNGGIFLTADPDVAGVYAGPHDGARTMPVYVKAENPAFIHPDDYSWDAIASAYSRGHDALITRADDGALSTVVVFEPEQIKSATANRGTFDPNDPSILNQPADGKPAARGQIAIGGNRRMSIQLFEQANLSTFLHESAHLFLELLQDVEADAAVQSDLAAIRAWVGNDGGAFTEEQHEQFARGFEAYLFEGRPPAQELMTAFAKLRAWMVDIYRAMVNLNVNLTDEVRSVFDRLIATDEEIEAAQVKQGMVPMVSQQQGRELGLSDAQWTAYVAALEAGTEEARKEVFGRLMDAHRKAREAQRREETARVREEVEAEAKLAPTVRAWRILSGAKQVNGEPVPDALRDLHLDPATLLPDDATAIKGMGVTRKVGGVSPDTAAAMLDYPTGEALMKALAGVRDLQTQIDVEVDRRMAERHPDPLDDGSLADAAMDAVHNHKRVAAMEAELDLLAQVSGQPKPNRRQLRAIAKARIASRRIRELRPNEHLAAERKAARAATAAAGKGDFAAALVAKREQLLQAALYSEAIAARDTVERHVAYARRFDKPRTRERIGKAGNGLLEMIEDVLGAYSFRPVSDKVRERTGTLRRWYDRMVEQGIDPVVPDAVLAQIEASRSTHYRELTVAELAGVVDTVRQLEQQAREANTLRLGEIEADLDAAETELAGAIRANLKDRGPPPISQSIRNGLPEMSKKGARMAAAVLLRLRTVAEWVDGAGNVQGAMHRYLIRPLDRAQAAYLDAMKDYGQKVIGLFDVHLKGQDITAPIWIASINQRLTKSDILAVALNTGNASNLQRLQGGRQWGDVQMMEILGHMTKADWDFVQGVWDTLESLWPQIAAQQKRLTGVEPPKIDRTPVTTPFGQYAGGYYPVVYDRESVQWEGVFGKAEESLFDPMAMTALPPNGHTKTRVEQASIPVRLDITAIPSHLSSILKDLTHRETVLGIRKLLKQEGVVAALHETLGPEASRLLNDKLKHVATDQVFQWAGSMKSIATVSHAIRRHTGVMAMGYNVGTVIKQVAGVSSAMEVMTQRFGARKAPALMASGYMAVIRGRGAAIETVKSLSGEMRHRLETQDADIRNAYNRYLAGEMAGGAGNAIKRGWAEVNLHAFAMIRYAQGYLVDIPTWLAAHEGALQRGMTGDDAVAFADGAVVASQGAGGAKDTALVEANIPGVELFTMFYSYANAYLQRQVTLGRDVGKAIEGGPARLFAEMPALSARFFYLSLLPVLVDEVFSQLIGQSEGPDDDEDVWGQAQFYALKAWAFQFYGVPVLRDLMPTVIGAKNLYSVSPAQSGFQSFITLSADVKKAMDGDAPDARKFAKDAVKAVGYTFGLPLGGPWNHLDYLWRVFDGTEEPESVPEFAAALAVGKRAEK